MNLPNSISIFRLLLLPIYWWLFFATFSGHQYWTVGVLLLAGITDVADGYIARKYGQVTVLGKILDPLADKLFAAVVFVSFLIANMISINLLAILLLREILMIGGAVVSRLCGRKILMANWLGKVSTLLFYIVWLALLIGYSWAEPLLWFAVIFAYSATLCYAVKSWKS